MKQIRLVVSMMSVLALTVTLAAATDTTSNETSDRVAPVASKPWQPPQGGSFNIPRSTKANMLRNERRVIAAINHTPRGHVIRMAMFSFDRHPVADALIRAKKRGVRVQVILNNHETTPAARRLRSVLTQRRNYPNFFYQCKASCRGHGDVQHSKFILFTKTGAARQVVMLGSLNMKKNGTHNQFNDLLTLKAQTGLHKYLFDVFVQMKHDRAIKASYLRKDFGPNERLWVMPFPRYSAATPATRYTVPRDPVNQILKPIQCKGANTASGRTIVRVSMHAWDKERGLMIARRFRDLWNAGCDVKIDVGFAGKKIRQLFATKFPRGYMRVRSSAFDTNDDGEIDKYSHLKMILINGKYDGRNRKVVVTGSSNFQNGGQYGDELFFRLYNGPIYGQYIKHWNRLYRHYTHGFVRMGNNFRTAEGPILTNGVNDKMPDWRDE